MAYTAHLNTPSDGLSTFVVTGDQEGSAAPSVMEPRVAMPRRAGTEVEYHKYEGFGYGFRPGTGTNAEGRIVDATRSSKIRR